MQRTPSEVLAVVELVGNTLFGTAVGSEETSAPAVGKIQYHIITLGADAVSEADFQSGVFQGTLFFPVSINSKHLIDRRIVQQHILHALIHQHIDSTLRPRLFQRIGDDGIEQHIAVVHHLNQQKTGMLQIGWHGLSVSKVVGKGIITIAR